MHCKVLIYLGWSVEVVLMKVQTVLKTVQRTRKAMEFLFLTPPVSFKEVFLGKDSGRQHAVF